MRKNASGVSLPPLEFPLLRLSPIWHEAWLEAWPQSRVKSTADLEIPYYTVACSGRKHLRTALPADVQTKEDRMPRYVYCPRLGLIEWEFASICKIEARSVHARTTVLVFYRISEPSCRVMDHDSRQHLETPCPGLEQTPPSRIARNTRRSSSAVEIGAEGNSAVPLPYANTWDTSDTYH